MSLQIYDLTHTYGQFMPEWPSHPGVDIDVLKSMPGTVCMRSNWEGIMHRGTHMDSPLHVTENTPDIMDYPLWQLCGTGVCVSIPKEKWGIITPGGSGGRHPQDPGGRYRDDQHRLPPQVGRL